MKTKKIITIITVAFMGVMITGYGRNTADKSLNSAAKAIHKVFAKSINYPVFGYDKDLNSNVEITFVLTKDGSIEIKNISSGSDELKNHVKNQLSKINIKDISQSPDQLYRIRIKFWPG